MGAQLFILLRYIGIFLLIIAVMLIIARWKFPVQTPRSRGFLAYLRDLWNAMRERHEDAREKSQNLTAIRNKTALLLDPDEKSSRIMTWRLESLGCEIIRARDGVQGLHNSQEYNPDFIIADALLTDMSASDFFYSLKDRSMPIIFIGVLRNQWEELHKLGYNVACFAKPYDPEEVASIAGYMLLRDKEKSVD